VVGEHAFYFWVGVLECGYKPKLGGSGRAWLYHRHFWPMVLVVWIFSELGELAGTAFFLILSVSTLNDPNCLRMRRMS
jgi:hypothetical protein